MRCHDDAANCIKVFSSRRVQGISRTAAKQNRKIRGIGWSIDAVGWWIERMSSVMRVRPKHEHQDRRLYSLTTPSLSQCMYRVECRRYASEEVVLNMLNTKCISAMLYGTNACPVMSRHKHSLDFVVTRVFMKILCTGSKEIVEEGFCLLATVLIFALLVFLVGSAHLKIVCAMCFNYDQARRHNEWAFRKSWYNRVVFVANIA